jgi:hypothetical protein
MMLPMSPSCLVLATLSYGPSSRLVEQDMGWVKLENGYTVQAFLDDAADGCNFKWPVIVKH